MASEGTDRAQVLVNVVRTEKCRLTYALNRTELFVLNGACLQATTLW